MTTIITGFGKFRYNHIPTGMCASEDIFQAKLDKILSYNEAIKTYTDDILVLSEAILYKHIYQIRVIFSRLRVPVLKVCAPKCSFALNEIPYLGYVITREGIKTNTKKVLEIMDLGRPETMTEEQALIGVDQY